MPQSAPRKLTYTSPENPRYKNLLIRMIETMSGAQKLELLYQELLTDLESSPLSFWEAALRRLELQLKFNPQTLANIPADQPLIFIANHPFGLLDGLVTCHLAAATRGDFKILINSALCREERIADYMLPIDFAETREAQRVNIATRKTALEVLKGNGTIIIFPAGGIATSKTAFGEATDLEWKLFMAKLIQQSQATVVPIYFHGQNSRIFQIVSQFSLTLRLSLILREVNRMVGQSIEFIIGSPIPYQDLAAIGDRRELTAYLRDLTYSLQAEPQKAFSS